MVLRMTTPLIEDGQVPVQITITTDLSREGLIALRDRIDQFLEGMPAPKSDEPAPTRATQVARDHVKASSSWERLSENTRDYLAACARLAQREDTFSIEDVAAEMGLEHPTVLAYHRNVMRTAAGAEPADWPLITSTRHAGRTQLSMTKGVAMKLLKLANHGGE
jgi:hypothetical protein